MSKSEMVRRLTQTIAECDRFIAKESARPADTRPADMQQHLDFCIGHKAKLENMMAEAVAA
jgi:hypothetical protein